MELQEQYEAFKNRGLGLAAISYDSQDILKSFAERKNITYPLLSDKGSQVITRFGILNEAIPKEGPRYGIPYPGQYIVDGNGVVQSKHFEEAYANRVTASSMLVRDLDESPDIAAIVRERTAYREHLAADGDRAHWLHGGVRRHPRQPRRGPRGQGGESICHDPSC